MKFVSLILLGLALSTQGRSSEMIDVYDVLNGYQFNDAPWTMERKVENNGVTFLAKFEFTKKGNGVFKISDHETIKIWDSHLDTETYEEGILHQHFKDIDLDGFNDLTLTGIKEVWDEKEEKIIKREPVVITLIFMPKTKSFRVAYSTEQ